MEPMTPISCPTTPRWNQDRPFLTGRFHQETRASSRFDDSKRFTPESSSNSGVEQAIGCYDTPVQELIVIDDLLSAMVGIEGRYISIKRVHGKEESIAFQVDPSMDLALQASSTLELAKRIFPLCECFLLIDQFVESSSQFKNGLVNHAFAAALRALLLDYQAMVAQLEHQFRLGRLSLQGLWFYCQPMMGSMRALAAVIHQASAKHFVGSAVLNLLQSQAKAMAGDNSVRSLLEKMTECASNAYLSILERWVYEGIIDDPYGEFFIAENRSLKKESLSQDSTAKYWSQRYSLKETIPGFLANIAATILTTGKYLNVMRECGHNVQVPISERSKLTIFGSNHHYLECIKAAHEFASKELVSLIKDKYDLIGRLRSIKHYLLLDQGDFLVHFMDIARDELNKKVHEISVEKLQSLLDLALRTTAAAADPRHEDLTCCVDRASLLTTLGMHKDLDSNSIEDPVSITGLETFSLSYKVLEPNWHVMHDRLQSTKSVDEVIQHHDFFLDKCLRGCLLLLPDVLKKMEKLKSVCLQYAAATQWLISSSIDINSQSHSQKTMIRDATVTESIFNFEREFNSELQSLGPVLSKGSQAEPYLTHLSQWILGVSKE
uniref:Gamma-tubulin complex component n=1 Tax=Brassica campestris TaxID=3711 RepID=M4CQB7_BRACM